MNVIQTLEKEEADRLLQGKKIPAFQPGDTVRVNVKIKEGERERVQAYEGVCIARSGGGLQENFNRPQDQLRRRRRAGLPGHVPDDRIHRGQTSRRRAARETLLSARSSRQVGADRRARHGAHQ